MTGSPSEDLGAVVGPGAGSDALEQDGLDASLSQIWAPMPEDVNPVATPDLGQRLLERGAISAEQLGAAGRVAAQSPGKSLAAVFLEMGIDEVAVQETRADVCGLEMVRFRPEDIDGGYLERLGIEFCQSSGVMPLGRQGRRLTIGLVDPDDLQMIEQLGHRLRKPIKPLVICPADVAVALEALKDDGGGEDAVAVDDIIAGIEESDVEVVESKEEELDLEKMAGESPVIRFVNYIIFNAVREGASDIHIEPQERKLQIRYRIDGVMFEMMNPPAHMHAAIVSRLKVMANLDISERRIPQDGRIRAVVHGRKLDLRISTLPTAQGEKVVLRLLDTRSIQVPLEELGMDEDHLVIWKHQVTQPHGIILVTGPTGSGKTTTLYASLGQMDRTRQNISTVEDPVEYHLAGISQCQTHEKIGMTFAVALRALLRQDPDVVMVGEIRDADTARIAMQASLTGHLVLSTLHTNDAPSSITRLINIGTEPYLIGAAVNACLAQRLVRRICPDCRVQVEPDESTAEHLALLGMRAEDLWRGSGCDRCRNTGYAGRRGLFELLVLDDFLRDKIAGNPSVTEFRRMCVERGMVTLRQDGYRKVESGMTTMDEVLRVTESTI